MSKKSIPSSKIMGLFVETLLQGYIRVLRIYIIYKEIYQHLLDTKSGDYYEWRREDESK